MDPATGGPCQGIRNSIAAMAVLGVTNEVVTVDDPDAPFLGMDVFPVHALGPGVGKWRFSARLLDWLVEHMLNFDAVIVHGLWLYHGYAVVRALNKLEKLQGLGQCRSTAGEDLLDKIPLVFLMPHGMLDPYFQQNKSRRFKALRNSCYWHLIEVKLVNRVDAILFTCADELRLAERTFSRYSPKRAIDIGYGVGEPPPLQSCFTAEISGLLPFLGNRRFLLYLSRIHEKKGIDILLESYFHLLEICGPGERYRMPCLVVAGPIDSQFAHDLVKKYSGRNFENCVPNNRIEMLESIFFTDLVSGLKKWSLLHLCDSFLLPSHQENFGIAIAEALACGKPVFVTDKVNIWREIRESGAGFIYGDSKEEICHLLQDAINISHSDREIAGVQARICYKNHFEISNRASFLIKTINDVLADKLKL